MPDDEADDLVVVRREREDREEWQGGRASPRRWRQQHRDGPQSLRRKDAHQRAVDLAELRGSRTEPINAAFAYASCTDCQTFAVALEIALIAPGASTIAPENHARAINYQV